LESEALLLPEQSSVDVMLADRRLMRFAELGEEQTRTSGRGVDIDRPGVRLTEIILKLGALEMQGAAFAVPVDKG
jgi:hypothetical protein